MEKTAHGGAQRVIKSRKGKLSGTYGVDEK
jgi:hypothetical protein